tara:strand:+ start:565 stop:816 length:252 start_codon:yes stop_codon:yes gene_type:complete
MIYNIVLKGIASLAVTSCVYYFFTYIDKDAINDKSIEEELETPKYNLRKRSESRTAATKLRGNEKITNREELYLVLLDEENNK